MTGPDPIADVLIETIRALVPDTHGVFMIVGERRLNERGGHEIAAMVRNISDEQLINLLESFIARMREEKAGLYG